MAFKATAILCTKAAAEGVDRGDLDRGMFLLYNVISLVFIKFFSLHDSSMNSFRV